MASKTVGEGPERRMMVEGEEVAAGVGEAAGPGELVGHGLRLQVGFWG